MVHASRGAQTIAMGSKLICVVGQDSKVYLSPDLIFHYVLDHHYAPPGEYVDAVLSGPRPGTVSYTHLTLPTKA